jgi:hypothetical protein
VWSMCSSLAQGSADGAEQLAQGEAMHRSGALPWSRDKPLVQLRDQYRDVQRSGSESEMTEIETPRALCPMCSDTGEVECEDCDGSGVDCPHCGRGDCGTCNGTGTVSCECSEG